MQTIQFYQYSLHPLAISPLGLGNCYQLELFLGGCDTLIGAVTVFNANLLCQDTAG